jgi:DHA2 family multidrug resistance protein
VLTTGLVTAPRGIGTLVAMLVAPRLMSKFDPRLIIGIGFALTAASAWQMTGFELQMGTSTVAWSGIAQGLGLGFVYLPVAAMTFTTLRPALRNEGTAIFSLLRNLGSSIGISMVVTLLTRNTQVAHASLAGHVSAYNRALQAITGASPTLRSLTTLNATVTQQAAMIAYIDDFKLLMVLCLATIPLVLLMRKGANAVSTEPVAVE